MPNKNKGNKTANALRTFKNSLHFHKLKAPTHPPEFTAVPWYPLTLRIQNAPSTVNLNTIREAFGSQLGFPDLFDIDFRLVSVHVWGALVSPAGSSYLNPVTAAIYDPIARAGGVNSILQVLTDYPDQVRRSAIGFKYSMPQQQAVLRTGTTGTLLQLSGVGSGSIVYIRMFWRTPNVSVQSSAIDEQEGDWQLPPKYNAVSPGKSPGPYAHCAGQLRHV